MTRKDLKDNYYSLETEKGYYIIRNSGNSTKEYINTRTATYQNKSNFIEGGITIEDGIYKEATLEEIEHLQQCHKNKQYQKYIPFLSTIIYDYQIF